MFTRRQQSMFNELQRISEKVLAALELLDTDIIPEDDKKKESILTMQLRKEFGDHAQRFFAKPLGFALEQTKTDIGYILFMLEQLQKPDSDPTLDKNKILIDLLEGLRNIQKNNVNLSLNFTIIKNDSEKKYNYSAHDLTNNKTWFEALPSLMISCIRTIGSIIDNLITFIRLQLRIGRDTYDDEGETPFALAITGRFQFFPNQATTLSDIMKELDKAVDIFKQEWPPSIKSPSDPS